MVHYDLTEMNYFSCCFSIFQGEVRKHSVTNVAVLVQYITDKVPSRLQLKIKKIRPVHCCVDESISR